MRKKHIKSLSGNYEEWLIESLRDKEEAAIFLQVALEEFQKDGDVEALLLSLRHVVEAQGGIGRLSQKTRLNRESLYRTLSKRGNPKFQTVGVLLKGMGFQLSVKPIYKKAS